MATQRSELDKLIVQLLKQDGRNMIGKHDVEAMRFVDRLIAGEVPSYEETGVFENHSTRANDYDYVGPNWDVIRQDNGWNHATVKFVQWQIEAFNHLAVVLAHSRHSSNNPDAHLASALLWFYGQITNSFAYAMQYDVG